MLDDKPAWGSWRYLLAWDVRPPKVVVGRPACACEACLVRARLGVWAAKRRQDSGENLAADDARALASVVARVRRLPRRP